MKGKQYSSKKLSRWRLIKDLIFNIILKINNMKNQKCYFDEVDEDDEVTHEQFFGENIKRLIKAFGK